MGVKRNSSRQMALNGPQRRVCGGLVFIALTLVFMVSISLGAPPDRFGEVKGEIVLDPGHGGDNYGAKGPSGVLEKNITLAFAQALAEALQPTYRIFLTRSDDYDVDPRERTAIANHNGANLFISIHTAADFTHTATGITIYSYQPLNGTHSRLAGRPQSVPADNRLWDQVQLPYTNASLELSKTLSEALATIPGAVQIQTREAPLIVLEGAAMPAVLIELGNLTHAATEQNLSSQTHIAAYAQAVAKGIEWYLADTPAKTDK